MNAITVSARKMTKRTCAIAAHAPAMPPNPKAAATIARMKNVSAQPSMSCSCLIRSVGILNASWGLRFRHANAWNFVAQAALTPRSAVVAGGHGDPI